MQGLGKREQLEHCKAQRFPAAAPAAAAADSPAVRAVYAGADLEFGEQIRASIVHAPPPKPGKNEPVEYRVSVAPEDGRVLRLERTKSSGLPDFDEAVRRAILKAQPYGARMLGWHGSMFWLIARPRESD
jgi:colicin import membrane protein